MLAVTRTWNAVAAVAGMHRALSLARDYARRRVAFGDAARAAPAPRRDARRARGGARGGVPPRLPRRRAPRPAARRARRPTPSARSCASSTPLAKLTTGEAGGRDRVGGARVLRRRGLRRGHRAAAAPARRAGAPDLGGDDERPRPRRAARARRGRRRRGARRGAPPARRRRRRTPRSGRRSRARSRAAERARAFLAAADGPAREAGARGVALTLGRALEVLLLASHAQWCLDAGRGRRALAAARRLGRAGVDVLVSARRGRGGAPRRGGDSARAPRASERVARCAAVRRARRTVRAGACLDDRSSAWNSRGAGPGWRGAAT